MNRRGGFSFHQLRERLRESYRSSPSGLVPAEVLDVRTIPEEQPELLQRFLAWKEKACTTR